MWGEYGHFLSGLFLSFQFYIFEKWPGEKNLLGPLKYLSKNKVKANGYENIFNVFLISTFELIE